MTLLRKKPAPFPGFSSPFGPDCPVAGSVCLPHIYATRSGAESPRATRPLSATLAHFDTDVPSQLLTRSRPAILSEVRSETFDSKSSEDLAVWATL